MEMTLEPVKFSLKNLYNYFKPTVKVVPSLPLFYSEANKLIDDNKVQGRTYTTQDIQALKDEVLKLEQLTESPEYTGDLSDYNKQIENLTLKIAARAYILYSKWIH